MPDREYKFGDVVEWDVNGPSYIRWFIIGGKSGDYQAICVYSPSSTAMRVGQVGLVGAKGTDDERLLSRSRWVL
jgi:hypothetical protein